MGKLQTVSSGFADAILGRPNSSGTAPSQNEVITGNPVGGPGSGVISNIPSKAVANGNNPPYRGSTGVDVTGGTDSNILSPVTLTINPTASDNQTFLDMLVLLPAPTRKIYIASEGANEASQQAAFCISLQPIFGFPAPTNVAYAQTGTEPWLPLRNTTQAGAVVDLTGITIEFRKPVTRFFAHAFGVNLQNVSDQITFLCADDLCGIVWRPVQPSNN